VILNFSYDTESLDICALKKSVLNDDNTEYNLISLEPDDGCSEFTTNLPPQNSSLYLKIQKPFNCQFSTVIRNVQALNPGFVIIGSDGPIVSYNIVLLIHR
jgi:hypothetical protein